MKRIGLTASEEMSFENVDRRTDDGRTTDTFIYYKLTNEPSAQVSYKWGKFGVGIKMINSDLVKLTTYIRFLLCLSLQYQGHNFSHHSI